MALTATATARVGTWHVLFVVCRHNVVFWRLISALFKACILLIVRYIHFTL